MGIRISYRKTRIAVDRMFEDYELLKFRVSEDNLPKMNASFNLVYSKPSGKPKSKIESYVEQKEELSERLDKFMTELTSAFNRLEPEERKILNFKYFTKFKLTDDDVMVKMGLSKYIYANAKESAYKKLALAMNIEEYE